MISASPIVTEVVRPVFVLFFQTSPRATCPEQDLLYEDIHRPTSDARSLRKCQRQIGYVLVLGEGDPTDDGISVVPEVDRVTNVPEQVQVRRRVYWGNRNVGHPRQGPQANTSTRIGPTLKLIAFLLMSHFSLLASCMIETVVCHLFLRLSHSDSPPPDVH